MWREFVVKLIPTFLQTRNLYKKTQISRKLHTFLGLQNLRTDKCHGVLAFSLRYSDKNVVS